MTKIHLGCSGWSYPDWIEGKNKKISGCNSLYPARIKSNQMLDFYAKVFETCEINTTFYNVPKKAIVLKWLNTVPRNFVFAAKLFQRFTHKQMTKKELSQGEIDYFFEQLVPLVSRKNPILWHRYH